MLLKKLLSCLILVAIVSGCTSVEEPPGDDTPHVSGNHAPISLPLSVITYKNVSRDFVLGGSDADGDELVFAIKSGPAHGTLSGEGADRTYTPAAGYVGSDEIKFSVSDGKEESAEETVSITVKAQADLALTPSTLAFGGVRVGSSKTMDVTVANTTDSDATNLAVSSSNASVVRAGGTCGSVLLKRASCTISFKYTPTAAQYGTANVSSTLTVSYNDGEKNSADSINSSAVARSPHAPVATALSLAVVKDVEKSFVLPVTDEDTGATLSYVVTEPAHGTISGTAPNLKYKPAAGYVGVDSFKFKAKDQANEFSNEITAAVSVVEPAVLTIPAGFWFGVVRVATPAATAEGTIEIQNASPTIATQMEFVSELASVAIIPNTDADACGQSLAAGTAASPSRCKIKLRFTGNNTLGNFSSKITVKYFNSAQMVSAFKYASGVMSDPGELDPGFGNNGRILGLTNIPNGNERMLASIQQTNGNLILAGSSATGLVRLLYTNGAVDPAFAKDDTSKNGIGATPATLLGETVSLALQEDGKILRMNQAYTQADGPKGLWIARNLPTGRIDSAFGTNGVVPAIPVYFPVSDRGAAFNTGRRNFWIRPAVTDRPMQIAFLGQKSATDTHAVMGRLKADGSPDTTLGANGIKQIPGLPVAYDMEAFSLANGRLLVKANELPGRGKTYIVMVNEEDLSEVPATEFTPIVLAQASNVPGPSALHVREFSNPYSAQFRLIRSGEMRLYNLKGQLVTAFGDHGVKTLPTYPGMNSIKVHSNLDFVLGGTLYVSATKYKFQVIRFKADGALDSTFGNNGVVTAQNIAGDELAIAKAIVIQSDQKLLLVGLENVSKKANLMRFLP